MFCAKRSFTAAAASGGQPSRHDGGESTDARWAHTPTQRRILQTILPTRERGDRPAENGDGEVNVNVGDWARVALEVEYLYPRNRDPSRSHPADEDEAADGVWYRLYKGLCGACLTVDINAVLLIALMFGGNEGSSNEGTEGKGALASLAIAPPDLEHLYRYAQTLMSDPEVGVQFTAEACTAAFVACARRWRRETTMRLACLMESDADIVADIVADIGAAYGHPWFASWLRSHPHVFCAGGAMVTALADGTPPAPASDIDLFVYDRTAWTAALLDLEARLPAPTPLVTQGAVVTFACPAALANVQLILCDDPSPEQIIARFDLDYAQMWCSAAGAFCTGGAAVALLTRTTRTVCLEYQRPTPHRIAKAKARGFRLDDGEEELLLEAEAEAEAEDYTCHRHLSEVQIGSDPRRAVALASALWRTSKVFESASAALANGFVARRFGTAAGEYSRVVDARSRRLPMERALRCGCCPPPFTAREEARLPGRYVVKPTIEVCPGPLYAPFDTPKHNFLVLALLTTHPGAERQFWSADAGERVGLPNGPPDHATRTRIVESFERLRVKCSDAIGQPAASFVGSRDGYTDLRVILLPNSRLRDAMTGQELDSVPAGSFVEARIHFAYTSTATPMAVVARGRLIDAKVYRPTHSVIQYDVRRGRTCF